MERGKMKRNVFWLFMGFLMFSGIIFSTQSFAAEKKGEYLLPGDFKEGWKVFSTKRCSQCHSIWGEGGKGGPDLGILPEHYVSQAQLAALMWNHGPEMWGRMLAKKIPFLKIDKKEMADLFAFLYFIRYMDEPGDARKGKVLVESKGCVKCHQAQGDLSRWGMYTNPIIWAQMMWNHAPQMEQEMRKKGISWVEFKENEMVDFIAYVRSVSPKAEKVYLAPADPMSGEKLFSGKGCIQCHGPGGNLDLAKRRDFPRTMAQLAGLMWNHSREMWKGMEEKGMKRRDLSPQEMGDLIAYLFSARYFDEPGDLERGKTVFAKKQCTLCHSKGAKMVSLAGTKGKISPIFMAQAMWNHGPEMLEQMRKAKMSWQEISGKEMVDLMEFLNRGTL
jgi:cytochrome c2